MAEGLNKVSGCDNPERTEEMIDVSKASSSKSQNPIDKQANTVLESGVIMKPKKIFISYSKVDRVAFLDPMLLYLKPLARGGKIKTWDDSEILPGEEWDDKIKAEIESADIIFLLVSAHSLNTDYIWNVEIEAAMRRHEQGTARVIPIILSKCRWDEKDYDGNYVFPPAKLNALPPKAKPIDEWSKQNDAWDAVATAINTIIESNSKKQQ